MNLEQSGRAAGAHAWWEERLFEVLGGFVPAIGYPAARVMLDRHSAHAAWRRGQWWERLPVLAGTDRTALVAPPPGADRLVREAAAAGDDLVRLATAYRVLLPRVAAGYHAHRQQAWSAGEGPALRTLAMVITDVTADWLEGETYLQGCMRAGAAVDAVASWVHRLEALTTA
jgi:hypothetical protein